MEQQLEETPVKPGYIPSLLKCKCARCRRGDMFVNPLTLFSSKKNMLMHDQCEVCGQPFEIEVGFYYGTGYVSYALTVAISVATFVGYWVLIGISIDDSSLFTWLIVNIIILILLMPYLMRLSRAIWLSFFVKYDKNWPKNKPRNAERMIKEMRNMW